MNDDSVVINSPAMSNLEKMRHSAAHVLAMAVKELYPDIQMGIGPVLSDRFYYEFSFTRRLNEKELEAVENKIYEIKKDEIPFQQIMMSKSEAIDLLTQKGELFKVEVAKEIADDELSLFKTGESFFDLCRGPHVEHTGEIGIVKVLGCDFHHWKEDDSRPELLRIYATAFNNSKDLNDFLEKTWEVKSLDHKNLSKVHDIYMLFEKKAAGMAGMKARGFYLKERISDYIRKAEIEAGFLRVSTPHFIKENYYEDEIQNGFIDPNRLIDVKIKNVKYFAKYSSKPFFADLFKSIPDYFNQLPIIYAEEFICLDNIKVKNVNGLFDLRSYSKYEAVSYCREDQVLQELFKLLKHQENLLKKLGFEKIKYQLVVGGKHYDKISYKDDRRNKMYDLLQQLITQSEIKSPEVMTEAYPLSPMITILLPDIYNNYHEIGLLYVDNFISENEGLEMAKSVVEEKETASEIVAVCATIIESFERLIGLFLENNRGELPVDMAPIQVVIIPENQLLADYAEGIYKHVLDSDVRAIVDLRHTEVDNKITDALKLSIPYIITVSENDRQNGVISVKERRGKELGLMKLDEFLQKISEDTE